MIQEKTYNELRTGFASPSSDFGVVYVWMWNGEMDEDVIDRQLDQMKSNGVEAVMIWAYHGLKIQYLSDIWFRRVQHAVERARELGMRVWIWDEGSYPSGSSGGRVVRNKLDVEAQALKLERIPVGGEVRVVQLMPDRLVAVHAARRGPGSDRKTLNAECVIDVTDKVTESWLEWNAPGGAWELLVISSEFCRVPYRFVHRGFTKDTSIPHPDHLKREATEEFIRTTHEAYRHYIGYEFGKTVVGFFTDEPGVPHPIWTDDFLEVFRARKGYDLRPHLASLFFESVPDNVKRVRHDYYDIWSQLYEERFFRPLGEWCRENGMLFTMHMGGEDVPAYLVREASGDYFRISKPVDIPGVDAIWRQIWPGVEQNLEKLASSAAHGWGRARSMSEINAVYGHGLSMEQAKWIVDHHLARGINMFLIMVFLYSTETFRWYFHPPSFSPDNVQWEFMEHYNRYTNRMSYLMSLGKPVMNIAIYYPTSSLWVGDDKSGDCTNAIGSALLARQRDFDFLPEDVLCKGCTVQDGKISVPGGCDYSVVIIPPCEVVSPEAMRKLMAFRNEGGTVISFGLPSSGGGFLDEPLEPLMDTLLAGERVHLLPEELATAGPPDELLPGADVRLFSPGKEIRYNHRTSKDVEVYFFHNEGDVTYVDEASLKGTGNPEIWDALSGGISPVWRWRKEHGRTILPLSLKPWESRVIVLAPGRERPHLLKADFGDVSDVHLEADGLKVYGLLNTGGYHHIMGTDGSRIYEWKGDFGPSGEPISVEGEWTLVRADGNRQITNELRDWSDWGWSDYSGRVTYRISWELPHEYMGHRLTLDLGQVRYAAKTWVNGEFTGSRAWRPFSFDISHAVKHGTNELVVTVTNTNANEIMGNPKRLAELRDSGLLEGSYFDRCAGFDAEQLPSGLLGPVSIAVQPYVTIWLR